MGGLQVHLHCRDGTTQVSLCLCPYRYSNLCSKCHSCTSDLPLTHDFPTQPSERTANCVVLRAPRSADAKGVHLLVWNAKILYHASRWRGRLNTMVQTGTFVGLVVASAINVGTNHLIWGWRLSLGLAAVPGAILLLGMLFLVKQHTAAARCCLADVVCFCVTSTCKRQPS